MTSPDIPFLISRVAERIDALPGRPHPYGDCDACGNPHRLMDAVEAEATRLGIDLGVTASNSWDMTISIGGRSLAQLLLALRQVPHPPTQEATIATLLDLVDGIDAVGG